MDKDSDNKEYLVARIQQLEHERDELHRDIEQLCMQQAGPGYLAVATKMHFQRTASLEQEIESLKKKLADCAREKSNLQEELSEAYRIKSQLADLHRVEATKNIEAEKQLKFFQTSVAAAFAERDHSVLEAEKAKENEELMSRKLNDSQKRLDELTSDYLELKKLNDTLQNDLAKQEELNENFKKVVDKFFEIRQQSCESFDDISWDDRCACLLHDPVQMWRFNDASTSKFISALEYELDTVRKSVDSLQYKLRMGLEIENHLKKNVRDLEKKKFALEEIVKKAIAGLRCYYSEYRVHVVSLLDEEKTHIKSVVDTVEEKLGKFDLGGAQRLIHPEREEKLDDNECRDVHVTDDANLHLVSKGNCPGLPESMVDGNDNSSDALALALREKVDALLLLSQQDERHLLERNVNAALQKKVEELQRNLLQVTNEKVRALMELAQIKQEYHQLREKLSPDIDQGKALAIVERTRTVHDGKLKNLLKKTYLKRWIGPAGYGNEGNSHQYSEGDFPNRSNSSMDVARMKIENATLKESLESLEHLTSSIHRFRLSLIEAKDSLTSGCSASSISSSLDDIIHETNLVKTALCSSIPVSWSAEVDSGSYGESVESLSGGFNSEKVDYVSAAGFEMVELLILASEVLKDSLTKEGSLKGKP